MDATFRTLAVTGAFALAAFLAVDFGLQLLSPIDHKREAEDGIEQFRKTDPEILVIGSSYARTLHVVGEHLAAAVRRDTPLVAIPVESGKLVPYEWLLENRLRPAIDARIGGTRPPAKLRRFVLVTSWWDSCAARNGVHWNLPSRTWALRHYVEDVVAHGMNSYNRNYAQYQVRRLFWFLALVRERTDPFAKEAIARFVKGMPRGRTQREYQEAIEEAQRAAEQGLDCIGSPSEMAALDRTLDFAAARQLDTTVVLFPMMPGTITPTANATTLERFRGMVEAHALPRGAKVIDLSLKSPLADADWMADFDHVNAAGNEKFAAWALENDLAFLLRPAGSVGQAAVQ